MTTHYPPPHDYLPASDDGAAVAGGVASVEDRLRTLEEGLAAVLEDLADHPQAGGPVTWSWLLATPEQAARLWADLAGFVAWLDERYLRWLTPESLRLPGCWWQHPVAVEELTALMAAHRDAVLTPRRTPGTTEPAEWHLRYLWPTLQRLSTELKLWKDCAGGHRALRESWVAGPEFDAYARADVARREQQATEQAREAEET